MPRERSFNFLSAFSRGFLVEIETIRRGIDRPALAELSRLESVVVVILRLTVAYQRRAAWATFTRTKIIN